MTRAYMLLQNRALAWSVLILASKFKIVECPRILLQNPAIERSVLTFCFEILLSRQASAHSASNGALACSFFRFGTTLRPNKKINIHSFEARGALAWVNLSRTLSAPCLHMLKPEIAQSAMSRSLKPENERSSLRSEAYWSDPFSISHVRPYALEPGRFVAVCFAYHFSQ